MTTMTLPVEKRTATWRTFLLIGVIGGVLSGAFGVGGGLIMVPLLITFAGMDQRRAAAASLVAIIPTSIAGALAYLVNGEVDVPVALVVAIGGVSGSYLGARLLRRLPMTWLRWMFIVLLVGAAARMLFVAPERGAVVGFTVVGVAGLVAAGLFMGVASGLFGVGGGVVLVPLLIAVFGAGDLVSKGTALLVMLPTAAMGTLTNMRGGIVDLRAGVTVGIAATLASFGGVAIAFLMTPRTSGMLFALLLLVSATQLTVRALRARS